MQASDCVHCHAQWRAPFFAAALAAGEVVACPAEGVWGLSCDPEDEDAVDCLLQMKRRPVDKGLIIVAADPHDFAPLMTRLTAAQQRTLLDSWPGPNTWLVPHGDLLPPWITGDSDHVAIRVTSAPALRALSRAFGGPLVSTSANPAGLPAPHTLWQVRRYFGTRLPAMPGGLDPAGKASTIRRVEDGALVRP